MSKIPSKFLAAIREGREFSVRYRWGEVFQGQVDWTEWDKGLLAYIEKANPNDEPGINILDEGGWGYAGREKDLEKIHGETIFGRYSDTEDQQHLLQVKFED